VDITASGVAWQLVQQFDAITIRVMDKQTLGHPVVDPTIECNALLLVIGELAQPGSPIRKRYRRVLDLYRHAEHFLVLGWCGSLVF